MVLMPHWIVCFWTGSGPDLEKFDLGTEEVGSAACHNYPPGPFTSTLGGERESLCLLELLLWLWPIRSVTGREESSWQNLYQPISTTAWHGKTARHSSHRRSVSWLSLCLSGSSATSVLLIVTHLAARHDSAVWRRSKVEAVSKSSRCKLLCGHSGNVLRALHFPYYSHGLSLCVLTFLWEITHISHPDPVKFDREIRRREQPETCTPVGQRASSCYLMDTVIGRFCSYKESLSSFWKQSHSEVFSPVFSVSLLQIGPTFL